MLTTYDPHTTVTLLLGKLTSAAHVRCPGRASCREKNGKKVVRCAHVLSTEHVQVVRFLITRTSSACIKSATLCLRALKSPRSTYLQRTNSQISPTFLYVQVRRVRTIA